MAVESPEEARRHFLAPHVLALQRAARRRAVREGLWQAEAERLAIPRIDQLLARHPPDVLGEKLELIFGRRGRKQRQKGKRSRRGAAPHIRDIERLYSLACLRL